MYTGTYFLYDCDRAAAERHFSVGNTFVEAGDTYRIDEVVWGPEAARENSTITNGPWRAKIRYSKVAAA